jgi:cytochrome b561
VMYGENTPLDGGSKYAIAIRYLHWIMGAMIFAMLVLGFISAGLPKTEPARHLYLGLHKSLGITLLGLAVLRSIIKLVTVTPSLPPAISSTQRIFARTAHLGLYALMFVMPVSGYVMSVSMGQPVRWFSLDVPRLLLEDRSRGMIAANVHVAAATLLLTVLALHIGAVAWHYFFHRVNLLRRVV